MHSAHTHGPGCAQVASALRPSLAHSAVSWRTPTLYHGQTRPCRRSVAARTGYVSGRVTRARCRMAGPLPTAPCRASCLACRNAPAPCHKALPSHIAALLCHITSQTVASSDEINFVSRLNPCQAMHARALPHALMRRPAVSWLCWPCRGAVSQGLLAVSWPLCCTPQCPVSRYNPLYHDSDWKMGSSPSSLLHKLFFFHIFFFLCSSYYKTTKK